MRILTFAMLFLLFLPIGHALSITNQSIDVVVGEGKSKNFSITNDKSHDCYSMEFISDDDITIATIDFLKKNTAESHTFSVMTDHSYDLQKQVKVKYLRKEFVPGEPLNYTITIEDDFSPNSQEMTDNDFVVFHNVDSINHTITDINGSFDYKIAPDTKLQLNFQKNTTVYDKVTNQSALIIIVPEEEQYVHYSDDDLNFSMRIISKHAGTGITLTLIEERIEAEYNETITSTILVETGNESAYNIHLEGADFEKNDFNLSAGKVEVVDFSIDLNFYRDDQTGKSHYFDISASGDNFNDVIVQLEIYVKEADIDEEADWKAFCEQDAKDLSKGDRLFWRVVCEGEQLVKTEIVTEYEEVIIDPYIEVTKSSLKEALDTSKEALEIAKGNEQTFNQRVPDIKDGVDNMTGIAQNIMLFTKQILSGYMNHTEARMMQLQAKLDDMEKEKRSKKLWGIFWTILITLGGLVGVGILALSRMKQHAEADM